MAESAARNIVILGASFAGLSAAHYLARHTLPKLKEAKDAKYVVHVVDPSTHFWWHIAAPRAIVSVKEMPHKDCFLPIEPMFDQYPGVKDMFVFHQASATDLDTEGRSVAITTADGNRESLDYYALIIATGIRSQTAATTLQGDYTISQKALEEMNSKLASAKDIVVGGGGPVGVETAGELGSHFGGKAKITLVAGADKLLPILNQKRSDKAAKLLQNLGVEVKYKTKVQSTQETAEGKTLVQLDNGDAITTDVYIPAVGMTPNTEFLPSGLKDAKGWVKTNHATLRVDAAGPRVYAVGDVAAVDKGGVLNLYNSFPVAGANITHDLFTDAKIAGAPAEKKYVFKDAETQIVPVGAKGGVGAFNGFGMPGFVIAKFKGKDYLLAQKGAITEGKQWKKA